MARYAQNLFQLQHDTQRIVVGQHHCLDTYAREVKSLKQEIERMGQEHGAMHQQLRVLESRVRDKDQELLTIYHRSSEHGQELLQHCDLLCEAEEATAAKAHELADFQATKVQEIEGLQDELQEHEEEL
jgi:cell division protein FtsB